jgi:hypothetical protein
MASNFRIYCHQNKDNLHLKLMGDFDGSSAYELINTLKNIAALPEESLFTRAFFLRFILLVWMYFKRIAPSKNYRGY